MSCLHSPTRTNQERRLFRHSLTRLETERALVSKTFEKCGEKRGPQGAAPVEPSAQKVAHKDALAPEMLPSCSPGSVLGGAQGGPQAGAGEFENKQRGEAVSSSEFVAPCSLSFPRSLVPPFLPPGTKADNRGQRRRKTSERDRDFASAADTAPATDRDTGRDTAADTTASSRSRTHARTHAHRHTHACSFSRRPFMSI